MNLLSNLEKRAASLGNYYQKYIYSIKKYQKSLVKALEYSGKSMHVHLNRSCFSPFDEMKIIRELSDDPKTQVEHLSCFYALQYLHMTFRNLDVLALGVASETSRTEVFHQFMMNIGKEFRELSSAYIENLLAIYLQDQTVPEFFICSVGTRADQDDIDVGIITADHTNIEPLNQAIRKITQHMLVYATPLHLYLSENVGRQVYTTTISEYDRLLRRHIQNVVIISELLNARFMVGSKRLFEEFRHKIVNRYFYLPENNIRYHEAYLRGILGEVRALLITPPQMDAIAPKYDAIRILKSLLYAKMTILNLDKVNAWDIINDLIYREPHFKSEYEQLFKSISFMELFKFLLQLYVIQEDTFRPDQIKPEHLGMIADRLGFKAIGMVNAWDQLLIEYYRHVTEIRRLADQMIADITRHLKKVSTFLGMLQHARQHRYEINIPKAMVRAGRFYAGTKYWEDVLDELEGDKDLCDAFIDGFEQLPRRARKMLIGLFADMSKYSMTTVFRLVSILGKRHNVKIGTTVYLQLNKSFLQTVEQVPRKVERMVRIFSYYPRVIHEYLQFLPVQHFKYMDRIFQEPFNVEELKDYYDQLYYLFNVHKWSSRYFHRFFYRLILHHPNYLKSLSDASELSILSSGLLAMVDLQKETSKKKTILGDYYDLEFLRVGIGTMRGADMEITNREFTLFCDNYIRKLFDVCLDEIEQSTGGYTQLSSLFAILAVGGHARGQAYDDDYDLIAVLDTRDEEVIRYATKVIMRMNREILKRGLLPHYRLGEILGGFVNPVDSIADYLAEDSEESFIDLSQLLGARMIIGSEEMELVIKHKILDRFVFKNKQNYIPKMIREIHNRQNLDLEQCRYSCNLKEARGGLRDIEAITLILKAYAGSYTALSEDFLKNMKTLLPDISDEIGDLIQSQYMLRTIRNLYRLTEAAEDQIQPDYLRQLAQIFKQNDRPELSTPNRIYNVIQDSLLRTQVACQRIINYILIHQS